MLKWVWIKCLGITDSLEAPRRYNRLFLSLENRHGQEGWFNATSGVKRWQCILCYLWANITHSSKPLEIVNKITIVTSWWWFSECHQSVHNGRSARVPSASELVLSHGQPTVTPWPECIVFGNPRGPWRLGCGYPVRTRRSKAEFSASARPAPGILPIRSGQGYSRCLLHPDTVPEGSNL